MESKKKRNAFSYRSFKIEVKEVKAMWPRLSYHQNILNYEPVLFSSFRLIAGYAIVAGGIQEQLNLFYSKPSRVSFTSRAKFALALFLTKP